MGFSFLKKIPIIPGFSLNISKTGISSSIGPTGVKVVTKLFGKDTGKSKLYAQKGPFRYNQSLTKGKKKKQE